MDEDLKKPWRICIAKQIIIIGKQLKMEECDQVLAVLLLNTPQKVKAFSEWARNKTVNHQIHSTPEEVMHVVSMIERGENPIA